MPLEWWADKWAVERGLLLNRAKQKETANRSAFAKTFNRGNNLASDNVKGQMKRNGLRQWGSASHSLAGTWEEAQNAVDATPVVYTIALNGSSIVVSGLDESDGTKLRISGVSWDGRQLRFKSLYPPTKHKASHVFQLTAKGRAIHTTTYTDDEGTWGGKEQWRKRTQARLRRD